MKQQKFDGIILDIDGTIWNTTGVVAVAWNRAIEQSSLPAKKVVAEILQKEFGKTMDVIAQDLWPNVSMSERPALLESCCKEEQIELEKTSWDLCYPSVVETVKKLSELYNFYVVSNCQSGYIEIMLKKTGLEKYIKDFECFGRTGKGKAENLIILKTRNNLHNPLYVGDTQTDCDSCIQAGIPFVWASYGFGTANSYYAKITTFSDLFQILFEAEEA